ncbi:hypothetical protein H0H93_003715 [Arthromyces matolae]|nr:hypothetical protein H0H93_003715 [Arthromyces matolae]
MASTSKAKVTVTYADVLKSLNTPELQADLDSALEQLSTTVVRLVESFECIAKQLHTIEMSGSTPPFKKRWSSLRKEFRELLWNYRSNASFISGRLKSVPSQSKPSSLILNIH